MEDVWSRFAPSRPFEYHFLDDQFDALYRAEERLGRLFGIFAALAIFTACLGLFGLSALVIRQRRKEIGVRKVLGANLGSIIVLVSKEYAAMVLVAFVLAAPVCYIAMNRWLESFSERVTIGPWMLGLAGVTALVLAVVTVAYHAIRSALADPVDSLRYE